MIKTDAKVVLESPYGQMRVPWGAIPNGTPGVVKGKDSGGALFVIFASYLVVSVPAHWLREVQAGAPTD